MNQYLISEELLKRLKDNTVIFEDRKTLAALLETGPISLSKIDFKTAKEHLDEMDQLTSQLQDIKKKYSLDKPMTDEEIASEFQEWFKSDRWHAIYCKDDLLMGWQAAFEYMQKDK